MFLSNEDFKTLFSMAPFMAALIDKKGNILICNSKFKKLACGATSHGLEGANIRDFFHEGMTRKEVRQLHSAVSSGKPSYGTLVQFETYEKSILTMKAHVFPFMEGEEISRVLVLCEDVTAWEEEQKELRYHSFHDELTGLYNRALFDEEVNRLDVDRYLPLSVCSVDIDALKFVNDVFGHAVGDELLKSVADCLSKTVRSNDIVARVGGDEFLVLLPGVDEEDAQRFAQRIVETVSSTQVRGLPAAASVGVATKTKKEEKFARALLEADTQMYTNKFAARKKVRSELVRTIEETLFKNVDGERDCAVLKGVLSALIAKEMGLDNKTIGHTARVGRYADIGMAGLRMGMLEKKKLPTKSEVVEIQKHVQRGFAILNESADLGDLAEDVYCHHERPDGKGYPRGLTADKIPLSSSIVGVADAVVSMSCGWHGLGRLEKDTILDILRKGAGTQFESRACEACIHVLEQGKFKLS